MKFLKFFMGRKRNKHKKNKNKRIKNYSNVVYKQGSLNIQNDIINKEMHSFIKEYTEKNEI